MKRFSKILCAILVLAVLCSSLAFVISSAEEFTPTATISSGGTSDASAIYGGGSDADNRVKYSFNNAGTDYTLHKVTRADGTDYYEVVSEVTAAPANHTQWNFDDKDAELLHYDESNNRYYVYELDIATETDITALSLVTNPQGYRTGRVDGNTYTPAWGGFTGTGTTSMLTANLGIEAGEFVHLALIIDVNNNMVYLYLDNELYTSMAFCSSDTDFAAWQNKTVDHSTGGYYYDFTQGIKIGFKLQAHSSYKVGSTPATNVTEGETILADNAYLTLLDSSSVGNLAEVLGSNLSAWTGNRFNADYDVPVIPDLVEIDGVRYNNVADAEQALAFALTPKNVTILRESLVDFVVSCDAVITTNGITTYSVVDTATVVDNGDGTVTVDAPFAENMSMTALAETGTLRAGSTVFDNAVDSSVPGNFITSVYLQNYSTAEKRINYLVTNLSTGDQYIYEYGNEDSSTDSYFNWNVDGNSNSTTQYIKNADRYILLDLDMAMDSYDNVAYFCTNSRNYSGSGIGATALNAATALSAAGVKAGEFAHLTLVYDTSTGTAYAFVNGEFATKYASALYNDDYESATPHYIQSIRVGQGSGKQNKFYYTNASLRIVTDASLATAISTGDLSVSANNLYTADYDLPESPALALVDGVAYSGLSEVEALLQGNNDNPTVVLLHKPETAIEVACNAVIQTNGLEDAINVISGTATWNEDNTICTVTGNPYNENLVKTEVSASSTGYASFISNIAGNSITNISNFNNSTDLANFNIYTAHTLGDTDTYALASVKNAYTWANSNYNSSNAYNNNPWFALETGNITLSTATSYYVVDVDVATYGNHIDGFNISCAVRASDGSTSAFAANALVASYVDSSDAWAHYTVVGDLTTNQLYIFVNGEYAGIAGTAYNADKVTDGTAIFQGARIELGQNYPGRTVTYNLGDNTAFDGFAVRYYTSNEESGDLAAALAAKSLNTWSNHSNGKAGEKLAPLAEVNGVEYSNTHTVEKALKTNDAVTAQLMSVPFTTISVHCNGTINTNGLGTDMIVAADGATITVDGDIITVTAPYTENLESVVLSSGLDAYAAIKYPAADNVTASSFNFTTKDSSAYNWGDEGFRQGNLVTNVDTGETFYYEHLVGDEKSQYATNEFLQINFSSRPTYDATKHIYQIVDIDIAVDGDNTGDIPMYHILRGFSSTVFGDKFNITPANIGADKVFIHMTMVYDFNTNMLYRFINGELVGTVENGALGSAANLTAFQNGTAITSSEFRIGSNSTGGYYLDNFYVRLYNPTIAEDNLEAALTARDITLWDGNVYDENYVMPTYPTLATVDGVDYISADKLSDDLYGNVETPKQVEFYHSTDEAIYVSCDAVIDTNGCILSGLTFAHGDKIVSGEYINFDCNYISDTLAENVTDYTAFTAAVKSADDGNLISNIWYNENNCFMNRTWTDENGDTVSGLKTYLVSSSTVTDQYGLIGRGELADGEPLTLSKILNDDGSVGAAGAYLQLQFNGSDTFTYSETENNYWIYDFDAYVEGDHLNIYAYNNIKQGSTFHYGEAESGNNLGKLITDNGYVGEFVHFTIVADLNNNETHVFINNEQVSTCSVAGNHEGITGAAEGTEFQNHGFRISFSGGEIGWNQSFAIDNVYAQHIHTSTSGNLGEVLAEQTPDLSQWTLARYSSSYVLPTAATVATVDGTAYTSIPAIEAAIAQPGNHSVTIEKEYRGTITVDGNAVIDTRKLTGGLEVVNTGTYEFMVDGENVTASSKYIHTVSGAVHTIAAITADNYEDNTIAVYWYTTPDSYDDELVVYYVFGDQIVAPVATDKGYIEDGKLVYVAWYDYSDDTKTPLTEFPIASNDMTSPNYACTRTETVADFAASGILHRIELNSNFVLTILVPADQTTSTGTIENIDGIDYLVLSVSLNANETAKTNRFAITVEDAEGNVYDQYITASVVGYVEALLADEDISTEEKQLAYAALAYSNEAYALLGGAKNTAITTLLESNLELAPTAATVEETDMDASGLTGTVRAVSLNLNDTPELILKLALGTKGAVSITYQSAGVTQTVEQTFDATSAEAYVVFDCFNVYDVHELITITVTLDSGDVCTGTIDLAGYALGLEWLSIDNDFAIALITYAQLAKAYTGA